MYELQTVVKTQPYLKDVRERRLPSTRRAQVQERELELARMQRLDPDDQIVGGGMLLGRVGARISGWLTIAAPRPAGDAKR